MKCIFFAEEKTYLENLMAQLDSIADMQMDREGFLDALSVIRFLQQETANVLILDFDAQFHQFSPGELIQILRDIQPSLYVIAVTQYITLAVEAFKARVNAFLVKPIFPNDLKNELTYYLHSHAMMLPRRIYAKTFGNFGLFIDGKPLAFRRAKAKELLAYLIDRRGSFVTNGQAISILWEDRENDHVTNSMYRTVVASMRSTLKDNGIEFILIKQRNNLAVDTEKFECDYYRFVEGKPTFGNDFVGEYMVNYDWAESTTALLQNKFLHPLK